MGRRLAGLANRLDEDGVELDRGELEARPRLRPRERQQVAHEAAHPLGLRPRVGEDGAPLRLIEAGARGQVEAGADRGQRRAQLVRSVAQEALERLVVLLEGRQHLVEGDGEVADLVVLRAGLDAGGEVAREGDRPGRLGHVGDRRQGAAGEEPAGDQGEAGDEDPAGDEGGADRPEQVAHRARRIGPHDVAGDGTSRSAHRPDGETERVGVEREVADDGAPPPRGVEVAALHRQDRRSGVGRVDDDGAAGVQDEDAAAGRGELSDELLRRLQAAPGIDVRGEHLGDVRGVGDERAVEGPLQLVAQDEVEAAPEYEEGSGEEPGEEESQSGPDRQAGTRPIHSFRT